MKKFLLVLAIFASMVSSSYALSLPMGPVTFHMTDWETQVTGIDQELSGIFRLDQLLDSNNAPVWTSGQQGVELTGEFGGLIVKDFSVPGAVNFTGGWLKIYEDTALNFNPTSPGTGVTDGTLWLDLEFITGGNGLYPTRTLTSSITVFGPDPEQNDAYIGSGNALLNVVQGSTATANAYFDSNKYKRNDGSGLYADVSLNNTFYILTTKTKDGWTVWSKDPVGANIVPEPASMLLFGMGVLGLASSKLRRKKAA